MILNFGGFFVDIIDIIISSKYFVTFLCASHFFYIFVVFFKYVYIDWDQIEKVACAFVYISSHYLLFVSITWTSQICFSYFWFELLRHFICRFNKWHNHPTRFVFHNNESVTKTELQKARIELIIISILKFLYINEYLMKH